MVIITVLAIFLAMLAIAPTLIWLLWPLVVTPLFGLPEIGWWQAAGLWIICGTLFKNQIVNLKNT